MRIWLAVGVFSVTLGYWGSARAEADMPDQAHKQTDLWLGKSDQLACGVISETLASAAVNAPISCLGTVAYDDLRLAKVYSPVSGMVAKIIAPLGARVAKGSPLAVLTSADMAGAKADLDRATASLTAATEAAARQRKLFKQKAASARDVESARDALRHAEAERARAAQQYALLTGGKKNAAEQNFTLRSPIAGEVVGRDVGLGSQVRGQYSGGSAPPLFTVADLSSVWLLADLQESEMGRVTRGATATVRSAAPVKAAAANALAGDAAANQKGSTHQSYVVSGSESTTTVLPTFSQGPAIVGTVDWLADVLDPASHTLKVRCVVDNQERRLRPNMRVVLDISGSAQAGLTVSTSSVVFLEQQPYAFVLLRERADGAQLFRLRPIELDDNSPGAQESANSDDDDPVGGDQGGRAVDYPAAATSHVKSRRRLVKSGLSYGERVVAAGTDCLLRSLAQANSKVLVK